MARIEDGEHEMSQGQRLLERMNHLRTSLHAISNNLTSSMEAIRGPANPRPEQNAARPSPGHHSDFFSGAEALISDLEGFADQIRSETSDLRERF